MWISPTLTLANDHVVLEPLAVAHSRELEEAVREGEIYRHFWTSTPSPQNMRADIEGKLARRDAGDMIPFAVRSAFTQQIVGVTTYYALQQEVPHLEIGYTWLAQSAQGCGINPAMKLLMLKYAFEELGCAAVGIRTKWSNQQSRRAIEKIGFKLDGILRASARHKNGALDDAVVYSMLSSEWPAVKALLHHRLASSSQ
ncbi:GNAT family N-acetyltransferase [Corynebacterium epidermidicanis]|uniref:Acetyltransferase, ribosomal protein N-acetylase n=1 Tax=Corynebacterium epidermidicanis TaxID=1050174 RepID=A0A0G3GWI6_9CORY|nr:GNAT family protein [Corynebacterium epidermidicanis]AKK03187.1 acetyltransferase, ribosomal protein N-acetylase [Corynebacterium epidermidicanis]